MKLFNKNKEGDEDSELIKELKKKDISTDVQSDFVEDQLLLNQYKAETGKKPIRNRKPTEAFIEWKEERYKKDAKKLFDHYKSMTGKDALTEDDKTTKDFKEWYQELTNNLSLLRGTIKEEIEEFHKKETKESLKERRLQKISDELATLFPLSDILEAKQHYNDKDFASPVLGHIERYYSDFKELIKDHHILSRAAEVGKKIWEPRKWYMKDPNVDLDKCHRTILILKNETTTDDDPENPYKMVIFYSEEPYENAFDWKLKVNGPVDKEESYWVPLEEGNGNIREFERARYDLPMCYLEHAPNKGYARTNIHFDEKQIYEEKARVLEDLADQINADKKLAEQKAKDHKKEARTFREINTELHAKMDASLKWFNKKLSKEKDARDLSEKVSSSKWGNIAFWAGVIITLLIIFWIIISSIASNAAPNEYEQLSDTAAMYFQMFQLFKFFTW
jgi:hypothetical protein